MAEADLEAGAPDREPPHLVGVEAAGQLEGDVPTADAVQLLGSEPAGRAADGRVRNVFARF